MTLNPARSRRTPSTISTCRSLNPGPSGSIPCDWMAKKPSTGSGGASMAMLAQKSRGGSCT
jgi:hypothetical protein